MFGRNYKSNKFQLLCSKIIKSEKSVQDIVLTIKEDILIDKLIMRGKFDNQIQIVLYGQYEERHH